MSQRKRYAIVGTGSRCSLFVEAICDKYADHAELVALCDISKVRMAYWQGEVNRLTGVQPPAYLADDFDRMISEQRPDAVIVTTMDCVHHVYIIRAMELGCDVITEKPMTTDEIKAAAIVDATERTGRNLRVAFNYRYMASVNALRELVMSGEIGEPTSVDMQWYLDTRHGADYFRRWHREMDKSGGLLVHKSTHHFDIVNYLLQSRPETVFAMGDLKFYGKTNAETRGERYDYQRYHGHVTPQQDPFAIDVSQKALYLPAEAETGYVRDRNVFGDDPPIDICDTHAVMVSYRSGAILNYSLLAYCPWEGERLTINGTKGQIEYFSRGSGHIIMGQSDAELAAEQYTGERYIRVQRMFHPPRHVPIPDVRGGHDGGDTLLCDRLFLPDLPPDPLKRDASHTDGAASILVGIAANRSIATGRPVRIADLLNFDRTAKHRPRPMRASASTEQF